MSDTITTERPTLEEIAKTLVAALTHLDEGHQARAAQILYNLIAKLPKQ